MKKSRHTQWLAILLALLMAVGMIPSAIAEETVLLDANLGDGTQWYKHKDGSGTYTKQEDGAYKLTGSGWFDHRTYGVKVGADCTLELSFTPASQDSYWGIYGRLDSVEATPQDPGHILDKGLGFIVRNLGTGGVYGGGEAVSVTYNGAVPHVMKLVLAGEKATVYFNGEQIAEYTVSKTTGDYVGFYAAISEGSVVNYFKINDQTVLGPNSAEFVPEAEKTTALDTALGDGTQWYKHKDGSGTYTKQEDGTYKLTGSGWFDHRTFASQVGADCTLEFSYTPASQDAWWGVYARLDSVDSTPQDPGNIRDQGLGYIARIMGSGGLVVTGDAVALEYNGAVPHVLKVVLTGSKSTVYFNGKLISEFEASKTTGDYVGFYAAIGEGSVVNYFKINGETVLGADNSSTPAPKPNPSEDLVPAKLQSWYGADLQQAAAQAGTLNVSGNPIYTTYGEVIGIRNPKGSMEGVLLHSMYMPDKYSMDDSLVTTVRLWSGEEIEGTLGILSMGYDLINSGDQYKFDLEINADEYGWAETQFDVYGNPYKEFYLYAYLDDPIYEMDGELFQIAYYTYGITDTVIYSMDVYNETTEEYVWKVNPSMLAEAQSIIGYETVSSEVGDVSGIVTYCGPESFPIRPIGIDATTTEPYNKYNSDGLDNRALVFELGRELPEGQYQFAIDFATCYTLVSEDRAIFEVVRRSGEEEEIVYTHTYTRDEAAERLGGFEYVDAMGMYDVYTIPVTVGADEAGSTYALRVYATNYSDVYYRSVTLNEMIPASLAAIRTVENQINDLPAVEALTLDDATKVAAARTSLDALETDLQAQVSNVAVLEAAEEKIEQLVRAYQNERAAAAQTVIDAIDAIGTVDETNYTAKKESIDAAQRALENYETTYSADSNAAALITNRQTLLDAQKAYSVQTVIAAIDAIGSVEEFSKENVDAKQGLVDAAQTAADALASDYGEDTLGEVTNYAAIADAQAKIDEIKAIPDFTPGKVNEDENIDASDALMALQHSVQLIKLEGNAFSAADVNGNETVDASDALLILQYSVRLIDKFPIEQ